MVVTIDPSLVSYLEDERPHTPAGNLSRAYRHVLVERAVMALFRWYVDKSQRLRNWSPDTSIPWDGIRKDLPEDMQRILVGFYGVEAYVSDYVLTLLRIIRRSQGRSFFHIRWGSEEEKHSQLWHNALLFSGSRSPKWLHDYWGDLTAKTWDLPFDDPIRMICYTGIQEPATRGNYVGALRKIGDPKDGRYYDPVLKTACGLIIADEAAHGAFFHELLRIYLYYFPDETLEALADVIGNFYMPGSYLKPPEPVVSALNDGSEAIYRSGIYGPKQALTIINATLAQFGFKDRKQLFNGIAKTRLVPDEDVGGLRDTMVKDEDAHAPYLRPGFFPGYDATALEHQLEASYRRWSAHEESFGLDRHDPLIFVPHPAPTE